LLKAGNQVTVTLSSNIFTEVLSKDGEKWRPRGRRSFFGSTYNDRGRFFDTR